MGLVYSFLVLGIACLKDYGCQQQYFAAKNMGAVSQPHLPPNSALCRNLQVIIFFGYINNRSFLIRMLHNESKCAHRLLPKGRIFCRYLQQVLRLLATESVYQAPGVGNLLSSLA